MYAEVFKPDLFRGKVALVTGAGRGIGAGIAKAFLTLGARTISHDLNAEALKARIDAAPDDCMTADLSKPQAADGMFDAAMERAGRIDFLINNAGISWAVETGEIERGKDPRAHRAQPQERALPVEASLSLMPESATAAAAIVQISSTAGITGFERRAVYVATKFAVVGLTKGWRSNMPRRHRVNAVLPHVVETEMFRTVAKPSRSRALAKGHSDRPLRDGGGCS